MAHLTDAKIAALARGAGLTNNQAIAMAVAIALAESGGITTKVSSSHDYGLWQINHRAHPNYDTNRLLSDPAYNAAAMAAISSNGASWTAWTSFKNGSYKPFYVRGVETTAHAAGVGDAVGGIEQAGKDAAHHVATGWVADLVSSASSALLTLVLATAGLAITGVGLYRLTGAKSVATKTMNAAQTGAGIAGLAKTVAL